MNSTLVTLIPLAIGVALSPAPIIELILVLFSKRRTVNAIAFIVTLWVCTAIAVVVGGLGGQAADGGAAGRRLSSAGCSRRSACCCS